MTSISRPALVLDTNTFDDKEFLKWLGRYHGEKIVPAVAYLELLLGDKASSKRMDEVIGILNRAGISRENYGEENVRKTATLCSWKWLDRDQRYDMMVASHALDPGRVLITNNVKHFPESALELFTPQEIMKVAALPKYGRKH
jgi:predicted nucleic acid-binding protein